MKKKNREMGKIFLTVFFGILVGAIVGQKLGGGLWALVGGVCGGIFAYFTYNFKVVINGICLATQETAPKLAERLRRSPRFIGGFILRSAMFGLGPILTLFIILASGLGVTDLFLLLCVAFLFATIMGSLITLSCCYLSYSDGGFATFDEIFEPQRAFRNLNPITVFCYWLPRLMLRSFARLLLFSIWSSVGFVHACKMSPATAKACLAFMGRWGNIFFRYIHSDARLVCFTFAFAGAAVGSLASDWTTTVLVALAGGLLGALEYYVVSVRWLKLQPGTARA